MIEDALALQAGTRPLSTPRVLSVDDAFGIIRRQWPTIVLATLLGATSAYVAMQAIPPIYEASAEIVVDPRAIQALDSQANSSDGSAQLVFVESQAHIITSESVLSRVVASEKLADDPAFAGDSRPGLLTRLGLTASSPRQDPDEARRNALATLAEHVAVHRPERTAILEIVVSAHEAEAAARLANAVAQAYFGEQTASHARAAQRANKALTERLADLRERVRASEERAERFARGHDLVGTRTQLVSEQQLTDATTQLAQIRARVIQAKTHLEEVGQVAKAGATLRDTLPEAVASPTMSGLRGQQAQARRDVEKALSQFGPRHPALRDARAELIGLDRSIAAELGRITQAAAVDYDRLSAAEAAQRKVVDGLSAQSADASAAFVQLGDFNREVEINKNLLNTFLSRARETSEIETVDPNEAHLISTALPPRNRKFPPRGSVVAGLGGLVGLAGGAALALLTEATGTGRTDRRTRPRRGQG